MDWNFSLIEDHPYAVAGIVLVGGVLLYFYYHSGSSSSSNSGAINVSTPAVDPNVQVASIQAGSAAQASAVAAGAAVSQQNFQYAVDQLSAATAIAQSTGDNSTALEAARIAAASGEAHDTATLQTQLSLATLSAGIQSAGIDAQSRLGLATLQSQDNQAESQQQTIRDAQANTVALSKIASDSQVSLSEINANTTHDQINSNLISFEDLVNSNYQIAIGSHDTTVPVSSTSNPVYAPYGGRPHVP